MDTEELLDAEDAKWQAVGWFEESGPLHYESHLVDLRRWCR